MTKPDLNLLLTLNVLLAEGSVVRAAQRLGLSPSAMSRALARLRQTTGDPLLVRAGRVLVPTPRALELREQVSQLVEGATLVLRPAEKLNLAQLRRIFTLRTSDGFVENFGAMLLARVNQDAAQVRLRFMQKMDKDSALLRDGIVDLETGVVGSSASPELRTRGLFRDRFIGVVRAGHSLSQGEISPERYASQGHIMISRRQGHKGPVDDALQLVGLERNAVTYVDGISTALALVKGSDLVATVAERHTQNLRSGMFSFPLPITSPVIMISMLWHPRMEADPAHRWLRQCVLDVCGDDHQGGITLPP
ncbi:LysR family transcriptional regulator [Yersinia enterocolitica]|uniref:Transcriptional activator protein NahR n=1 Tax=Yersinia enterocolitica serotype O:8 / biotype 1B (strain NCTC 13174 / 8081) TaxID=393305 RepID=A1JM31_YERE8|nr:LysR family transcriptional regulator [Yersinia enterocolitica]AJJ24823.1 bacterial regulatory helix-turn-helix, lysR family protein [Yersinia enterocolitica]ELI8284152.1 LysR family transcriptional regulator [Yersinia enterocolitica]KGA78198.1 bacterial regulatory helix-turn-helix, lysR family protein [Yersinia enterocolitica]MCE3129632.1 LysR family transcriptional regulator [Yersinia enterocolitica]RLY98773.1 LysR family transcriptional regulator [Yersinia enterocolitica]